MRSSLMQLKLLQPPCLSVCQSVPAVPCRVRGHAAHGVGRRCATHARPWAAARRSRVDSHGHWGTRSGCITLKPYLLCIADRAFGRGRGTGQ